MNLITVIGLIAGALTTISFVPQLIKTVKTKSAKDVSLGMFLLSSMGVFLWLIYGIMLSAIPIIIANAITFVLAVSILVLKIRYGKKS